MHTAHCTKMCFIRVSKHGSHCNSKDLNIRWVVADRLSQNHCGVTARNDQVLEEIIIDVRDLMRMSGQLCNKPKQLAEGEE